MPENVQLSKEFADIFQFKGEYPPLIVAENVVRVVNKPLPPRIVRIPFLSQTIGSEAIKATCPAGKVWRLTRCLIRVATSATAGNRILDWIGDDVNGTIMFFNSNNTNQAASSTYNYILGDYAKNSTNTFQQCPSGELYLHANETLTLKDRNDVDANDTATGYMEFEEWDV